MERNLTTNFFNLFVKAETKMVVQTRKLSQNRNSDLKQNSSMKKGQEFNIENVIGDGNCLFRAISLFLYGHENCHGEIRKEVVKYTAEHWETLKSFIFIDDDNLKSKQNYLKYMSTDGVFGTSLELHVISLIRRLQIFIFNRKKVNPKLKKIIFEDKATIIGKGGYKCIYLLLVGNNESGHFQLLRKRKSKENTAEARDLGKKTVQKLSCSPDSECNIDPKDNLVITCNGKCRRIFHLKCVDINKQQLNTISKCPGVFWFCPKCCIQKHSSMDISAKSSQNIEDSCGYCENFNKSLTVKIESLTVMVSELNSKFTQLKTKFNVDNGILVGHKNIEENSSLPASQNKLSQENCLNNVLSNRTSVKKPPQIVIRPKNPQRNVEEVQNDIFSKINPVDIAVSVENVRTNKSGNIMIQCLDESSSEKLKDAAVSMLSDTYNINVQSKWNPKLRIIGVDQAQTINIDNLINKIVTQNFNGDCNDVKFVKMYEVSKKKGVNVILELSRDKFNFLLERSNHIYVEWKRYFINEYIDIAQCYKCWKMGHVAKYCRKKENTCPKCSGDHKSEHCASAINICVNCKYAFEVMKVPNIKYNHAATDRNQCYYYQTMVDRFKYKIKNPQ